MEQKYHNHADAPTPTEFNQRDMEPQNLTPEQIKLRQEILRQHPELFPGYSNKLDGPKWLFIVVAVSMILGVILFCVGVFFSESNEDLCGWLAGIGLTLFIVVPTIFAAIDKLRREKRDREKTRMWPIHRMGTPIHTDEDTNFDPHTPAAWIMVFGGISVVLFIAAILVIPQLFAGQTVFPVCTALGFLGCLLLTIALAADGRHDAAITWGIFSIAAGGMLLLNLINYVQPQWNESVLRSYAWSFFGLVLMLCPLFFILIKRLTCHETLTAACIHQEHIHSRKGSIHDAYIHFWKYSFNEKTYIHKEYCLLRNDSDQNEAPIHIHPNHPQMFYRRSFPLIYFYLQLSGLFIFVINII